MNLKLPNRALIAYKELSQKIIKIGCESYHDACRYVWKLPYGRTSDSSNWRLVLSENVGTCSTKHVLLSVLARELELEIDLTLGIYPMKESNTPGVGGILLLENMEYIPEAHCY